MKKRSVKLLSLGIILSLAVSLFSGCSGKNALSNPANNSSSSSTSASKPADSKPAEKITLNYWTALDGKAAATAKNYNDLACYQELEKRTGIHINFLHPPVGQETEQFNLMIASKNLPDLIWYNWPSISGGPAKALSDGTLIKLNDQIDKNMPNLKKVFEKYPDARKQSMMDDGTFYMLPFIKPDPKVKTYFGPQLRKDWLDKLGLQSPKTIDDWYTVLKAFKEKDPNGNGKNDELPFISAGITGGITYLTAAYGIDYGFYQDKGTIKYGPMQPQYKDFLTTMRKWYKEGLIDPDFASTDAKQFDSKVTNNQAGAYYGLTSGNMGRYLGARKGDGTTFDLVAAPWPTSAPGGVSYYTHTDWIKAIPGPSLGITSKNQHVAESVKWADYQYSDEGQILMNFGIEGESYKMVNGYPTYTDIILNNPKLSPDQAIAKYATTFGSTNVYDSRYIEQIFALPEQKDSLKLWAASNPSLMLPNITPTAEESSKLSKIINEINTFRDESFIKFVLGQEPIENYDKYVQNLKSMGIDDAIKIEQSALDRFNTRK